MPSRNSTTEVLVARGESEVRDLQKAIDAIVEMASAVGDVGSESSNAEPSIGKLAAGFTLALGAANAAKAGFDAVKDVLSATVGEAFSQESAMGRLQAQTGLTGDALADMEQVAEGVFTAGFGDSFGDVADSVSSIQRITGLAGDELQDMTEDALMMQDVFDADVTESVRAASNMMEAFGISGEEAMDFLARGFQMTGDPAGDLLDTFNEYSTTFADMGLNATQAMGLLSQGLDSGAMNTDVMADALKEFNIRIKDNPDLMADMFDGMDDQGFYDDFAGGYANAGDALGFTLDMLKQMEDPVARNAAAVALFGTKWEDLGDSIGDLDMGAVFEDVGDVTDVTENMSDATTDLGFQWKSLKRTVQQVITNAIEPYVKSFIDKAIPAMQDFGEWFEEDGVPLLEDFFDMVEGGVETLEGFADTILGAFGFDNLGDVGSFADQLKGAFDTGGLDGMMDVLKAKLAEGVANLIPMAKENILDPIASAVKDPANQQAFLDGLVSIARTLFNAEVAYLNFVKDNILDPIAEAVKDPDNQAAFVDSLRSIVGAIFAGAWEAAEFVRSDIIDPIKAEILGFEGGTDGEAVRALVGQLLAGVWTASEWVAEKIIDPAKAALLGEGGEDASGGEVVQKMIGVLLAGAWEASEWVREKILTPIGDAITNSDNQQAALDLVSSILDSAIDTHNKATFWVWNNVITPITGKIRDAVFSVDADFINKVFNALVGGVDVASKALFWVASNVLTPITGKIKDAVFSFDTDILGKVFNALVGGVDVVIKAGEWVGSNILTPITTSITDAVFSFDTDFVGDIFTALGGVDDAAIKAAGWIGENIIHPLKTAFGLLFGGDGEEGGASLFDSITGVGDSIFGAIKNTLPDIIGWVRQNIVKPFVDALNDLLPNELSFEATMSVPRDPFGVADHFGVPESVTLGAALDFPDNPIPGFAEGGDFIVPGSGRGDRPFTMGLEPGERVQITPRNRVGQGGRMAQYNIPLNIDGRQMLNAIIQVDLDSGNPVLVKAG